MIFKLYFYTFVTSSVLGWILMGTTLTRLDPFGEHATIALILFLASIFIATFGTFGVLAYNVRIHFSKTPLLSCHLFDMFRYGILLASFVCMLLYFWGQGILTYLLSFITFIILLLLEIVFHILHL
jgi:hypothetical protein